MTFSDLIDPFRPAGSPPPKTLAAFIRWCLKGSWPVLIVAAVISGLAGFTETGTAWVLGKIIDGVTAQGAEGFWSVQNLGILFLALAFFLIARPLSFAASNFTTGVVVAPNMGPMVVTRLQRWMLSQSVDFFDDDFAGRLAQKQAQTANSITEFVVESINIIAFALATLAGTFALILGISGWLGLVFILWLAAYFALISWFLPRIRKRSTARAAARARVTGQVVDTITNIRTVKLFGRGAREDEAVRETVTDFRDTMIGFGKISAGFRFSLMFLAGFLPLLMVGGSLLAWQAGHASTGEVVSAGVISIRIAQMTGWVSFGLMNLYRDLGEIEDGMNTLTPDRRLLDAPKAPALTVDKGEITFDKVSFAYGRRTGGVQGIDLTVKAGEKLAIVGPSGAGKSTIVSLLLRLYDPEEGRILIDGQDIKGVTQDSLRKAIGMVTQDTAMFNRSARDNILYGDPEADEKALIRAAEQAEAHEFIGTLIDGAGREGYEAHLGERGVKLSGGQRQRIAIARVMLKDAPILVLDEATSALDSEAEAAIQETLYGVMQGKTVIAIAHRLSTIAQMDRILVLKDGGVAEDGTHDDLLAKGGIYAGLWERQSGGFLADD